MNREKAERLLAALIFDDLDEASKADLLAYLRTDDELRERLADMRMAAKVVSDALQHGPDPVLDKKRLKRLERLAGRRSAQRVFFTRPRLAAAAAIVAAVLLPALVILPSMNRARTYSVGLAMSSKGWTEYNVEFRGGDSSARSPETFVKLPISYPHATQPSGGGVFYFGDEDRVSVSNSTLKNLPGGVAATSMVAHGDPVLEYSATSTVDAVTDDYVVAAHKGGGTGAPSMLSTPGGGPEGVTDVWRKSRSSDDFGAYASGAELPSATWETPLSTLGSQSQNIHYVLPPESTYSFVPPESTVTLFNDSLADIKSGDSTDFGATITNSDFAGNVATNGQNVLFKDGHFTGTAEGITSNNYDIDARRAAPTEKTEDPLADTSQPGKPQAPTESYRYVDAPSEPRLWGDRVVVTGPAVADSAEKAGSGAMVGTDLGSTRYVPAVAQKLDLGAESEVLDREKLPSITTTYGTTKQHSRRDEVSAEEEMLESAKSAEKYKSDSAEVDEKTVTLVDGRRSPAGERRVGDNGFEFDAAKKEVKDEKKQGNVPLLGDIPTTGLLFSTHGAKDGLSEEHAKRQGQVGAIADYVKSKSEPGPKGPAMRPELKPDDMGPADELRIEAFYDGKALTGDEARARGMFGMGWYSGGYGGRGGMMGGGMSGDMGGAGGMGGLGGNGVRAGAGSISSVDGDDMFVSINGGDLSKHRFYDGRVTTDLDAVTLTTTAPRVSGVSEVGGPEGESSLLGKEYEIINLRHLDPMEVKDSVGDGFRDLPGTQLMPKVVIEPLRDTKQVIVFGNKEMREKAKKMIEKIDTPAGQPTVEDAGELGEEDVSDLPEAARFKLVPVNPWVMTQSDSLSTFALDVDTASYTLCRRYIRGGFLPPAGAVRMEEFINYFNYDYPQRANPTFEVHAQAARSPFAREGQELTLLKIGVKARTLGRDQRRAAHLIIVVDASASMDQADRLPLVQNALGLLVDKLSPADRVSLITCSREARLHLEAVSAQQGNKIREALDAIQPSGPTNLLAGLKLGYATARKKFDPKQINHVVLCSDGVANVGETEAEAVLKEVSADRKQGIAITCVGVGYGAYNDAFLESLANRGDGSYVFLDSMRQARRVFVDQLAATLHTVAKDARIQVEFDPKQVRRYRLIGYENRDIEDKRFRDDTVDAGEVGSGQCSTALYELELTAQPSADRQEVLGTVFVRYRNVETGQIEEISEQLSSTVVRRLTVESAPRFFLAAAAARFAEILRESEHAQQANLTDLQRVAEQVSLALPLDRDVRQLAELIRKAENLPEAP